LNKKDIKSILIQYVIKATFSDKISSKNIDLDKSLLDTGILDSYGIIELTEYIESKWNFVIPEEEFILENFGSVNKMTNYIYSKLSSEIF